MSKQKREAREEKLLAIKKQQEKEARQRKTLFAVSIGAVLIAFAVAVWIIFQAGANLTPRGSKVPEVGYNSSAQLEITDTSIILGDQDAEPSVTVFEDLMCPYCAMFEQDGGQALVEAASKGDARVEYVVVSMLNSNSRDNYYSTRAANALVAAAVHSPEQWVEFHDALYVAQPAPGSTLTDDEILDIAGNVGISSADFEADVRDVAYADWVSGATQWARESGIQGTPTVLLDGQETNMRTYAEWAQQLGL